MLLLIILAMAEEKATQNTAADSQPVSAALLREIL
jgi:hypothetical protein